MRSRVPPQVCSTSSGWAAMARMSSGRSMLAEVKLSCQRIVCYRGSAIPALKTLSYGQQRYQRHAGDKTANVREPRDAALLRLGRITDRADSAVELDQEPVDQQKRSGNAHGRDENEQK